ncbi:MAG TPA: stalk domain-containing protein [Syntrophomonadaceae bacterium]|nr:stalk domain-containing protein [Syntrophomonadaceae bacterium]
MQKTIIVLAIILSIIVIPLTAQADDAPRVILDGQELSFEVQPVIVDGRVLVPMREILNYLGFNNIFWYSDTMSVNFANNNTVSSFITVGSRTAWVKNKEIQLDVPPMIVDGRTMVPLRFVAESASCAVKYDPLSNIVNIQSLGSSNDVNLDDNVWLYYSVNGDDSRRIIKQRPDGSANKTVYALQGDACIYNLRENEHHISFNRGDSADAYGIDDADTVTVLKPWEDDFAVNRNYLYYSDIDFCYKIRAQENWIYYINTGEKSLYRVQSDGSSKTMIVNADLSYNWEYEIVNGYIYYLAWDQHLYRVNLDGSGKVQITSKPVEHFAITDKEIYYDLPVYNYDNDHREIVGVDGICKASIDGSNTVKICDDGGYLAISNGWIYYISFNNTGALYAIRTDGSDKTKIVNERVTEVVLR